MTFTDQPNGVTAMAGAAEVIEFQTATLPILIDRASRALLDAKTSAEVLEARDMARVAYDAAKAKGRYAKGKEAYDEVMQAVRAAQAKAQEIAIRAEMRFIEEYDSAKERGEVASAGKPVNVSDGNDKPTAADLNVTRKETHQARKLLEAEKASPGKAKAAIEDIVARGEEPTRAKVQREVVEKPAALAKVPAAPIDPERRKLAKLTPDALIDEVLGLRADLADAKSKLKKQTDEIKALKDQVKSFEGDQAETIRNQANIIRHKESEMYRANDTADRALARAKKAEKRVAELEKMGIAV